MKLNSIAFGQAAGLSYMLMLILSLMFTSGTSINFGPALILTGCYFIIGYIFAEFYNSRLKRK